MNFWWIKEKSYFFLCLVLSSTGQPTPTLPNTIHPDLDSIKILLKKTAQYLFNFKICSSVRKCFFNNWFWPKIITKTFGFINLISAKYQRYWSPIDWNQKKKLISSYWKTISYLSPNFLIIFSEVLAISKILHRLQMKVSHSLPKIEDSKKLSC